MKIDVLYFEGCPDFEPTVDLIREVLSSTGTSAEIETTEINNHREAEQHRFFGSVTILVDGVDIDPDMRDRNDYGMSCRTYDGEGVPPREMIEAALKAAN